MRSGLNVVFSMVVFFLGFASVASAADEPLPDVRPTLKMRVLIVRDATLKCAPDCVEWISAEGGIDSSTPGEFDRAFAAMGTRKLPIFINSPGGSVGDALQVGQAIRAHGLDVAVAHTVLSACRNNRKACLAAEANDSAEGTPDSTHAVCASSCALILAAGKERVAPYWARIGVHRSFEAGIGDFRAEPLAGHENSPGDKIYAVVSRYYRTMGISPNIMQPLVAAPYKSIHWLTREELIETTLVTREAEPRALLPGWKQTPLPRVAAHDLGTEMRGRITQTTEQRHKISLDFTLRHRPKSPVVVVALNPIGAMAGMPAAEVMLANGRRLPMTHGSTDASLVAEIPLSDLCDRGAYEGLTFAVVIGQPFDSFAISTDAEMSQTLTKALAGACAGLPKPADLLAATGSTDLFSVGQQMMGLRVTLQFRPSDDHIDAFLQPEVDGSPFPIDDAATGYARIGASEYAVTRDDAGPARRLRAQIPTQSFCTVHLARLKRLIFAIRLPALANFTLVRNLNLAQTEALEGMFRAICPGAVAAVAETSSQLSVHGSVTIDQPKSSPSTYAVTFELDKPLPTVTLTIEEAAQDKPKQSYPTVDGQQVYPDFVRRGAYVIDPNGKRLIAVGMRDAQRQPILVAGMSRDVFCAVRKARAWKFRVGIRTDADGPASEGVLDMTGLAELNSLFREACDGLP